MVELEGERGTEQKRMNERIMIVRLQLWTGPEHTVGNIFFKNLPIPRVSRKQIIVIMILG